jgi:hypothetical protein
MRRRDVIVASFTGAWIETSQSSRAAAVDRVASFTGAWIETMSHISAASCRASDRRGLGGEFSASFCATPGR